jgi:GGDEF domain-containing protein
MPVLTRPAVPLQPEQLEGESTAFQAYQAAFAETLATGPTAGLITAADLEDAEVGAQQTAGALFMATRGGLPLAPPPSLSPRVSPEQARQEVKDAGLEGQVPLENYPTGPRRATLDLLLEMNKAKQRRQTISQQYDGFAPDLAGMVIGSLVDPTNIGLAFVPVVGEARYAQLLTRVGESVASRLAVRGAVGAVEGTVGAALVEPLIYSGQQQWRNDYDAYDSMLNIAGGAAFGALLHGGAGLVKDAFGRPVQPTIPSRETFADPDVYAAQAFRAKARAAGVSEAAMAQLTPQAARDDVTGFFDGRQSGVKVGTLERAMLHVKQTQEPAYFIAADITNLGGLNAHVGNVAEAANVHYRAMAQALERELRGTGGDVVALRTGGDELGLVVVNADAGAVEAALRRVDERIALYAEQHGLAAIPNPKRSNELGVGLHTGASPITPGLSAAEILRRADLGIDASKRGLRDVGRTEAPADRPGPDTGSGAQRVPGRADAPAGRARGRTAADAAAVIDTHLAELRQRSQAPGDLKALTDEAAELAALLREQAGVRSRLTPEERAFIAQRQAEIRRQQEAIRTAQGYANELASLQKKLGKIDRDSDLFALAEQLSPAGDVFAPIRSFVASLDPAVQAAAFRQGMAQLADGRPVDITPALLANSDPPEAVARALRNADQVDGVDANAPAPPAPKDLELADLQERLADLEARIGELPPLDPDLKLQRDAVKAASLCLMRNA